MDGIILAVVMTLFLLEGMAVTFKLLTKAAGPLIFA